VTTPLLAVDNLHVSSATPQGELRAVQGVSLSLERGTTLGIVGESGVSFTLHAGETLGLVGESGCGKSTTGRAIAQVEKPTSGSITFDGAEVTSLNRSDLRHLRTEVQMIFQNPMSSLNPRRRVADIVAEPLNIGKIGTKGERRDKVNAILDSVGIDPYVAGGRYPREFSGGQCQRISIARALVLEPKLLVCDLAHDLAVVKNVSDRVAVMYLGRLCEIAPSDVLYAAPAHHYTEALLSSAVEPNPEVTRTPSFSRENRQARSIPHRDAAFAFDAPRGGSVRRRSSRTPPDRPRAIKWPATFPSGRSIVVLVVLVVPSGARPSSRHTRGCGVGRLAPRPPRSAHRSLAGARRARW
jgi:peptide/nickel transport system ATP-binding protein